MYFCGCKLESMLKIFETETIKTLDQYTINHEPVDSIDLTERAAAAFVHEFGYHFSRQKRIIIFAGQGNNGADALAVARLLHEDDYRVETCLINPQGYLSPDCEKNRQRLLAMPAVRLIEVVAGRDFQPPELTAADVVIDGLFGSGLNRPLQGGYVPLIDYINRSTATVVSIDIPSGLFGEDNRTNNPSNIIRATRTFAFEFPKLAFFLPENANFVGEWKVLPIGIHPEAIEQTDTPYRIVTDEDIANMLIPRNRFAHKGDFGHALLIAGSKGKMGAATLAASACLRSGVGLLTVHLPLRGETTLQTVVPEAMLSLDAHEDFVSELPEINPYKAVGIGPGLGIQSSSAAVLKDLLLSVKTPLALDADALNILADNEWQDMLPARTILTPHPKEFDRLFGKSASGYERLHKAMEKAVKHKIVILLKGAFSATCTPDGQVCFNSTGNPGMATAGSGDVLTGVLLGLLAQGYSPETAAVVGAYLHGQAGNLAAAMYSEEGMIAGDISQMLGKAFGLQQEQAV